MTGLAALLVTAVGLAALLGTAVGTVSFTIWRQSSFFSNPGFFVLHLCAATLLPLAGYLAFLRLGYVTFSWGHGSLFPIGIAASATAAALLLLLQGQSFRLSTKFLLVSGCGAAWFVLVMVCGVYIACGAGDCI